MLILPGRYLLNEITDLPEEDSIPVLVRKMQHDGAKLSNTTIELTFAHSHGVGGLKS